MANQNNGIDPGLRFRKPVIYRVTPAGIPNAIPKEFMAYEKACRYAVASAVASGQVHFVESVNGLAKLRQAVHPNS